MPQWTPAVINLSNLKRSFQGTRKGHVFGHFGVHEESATGCVITHLATGLAVQRGLTTADAQYKAQKLETLLTHIDWDSPTMDTELSTNDKADIRGVLGRA